MMMMVVMVILIGIVATCQGLSAVANFEICTPYPVSQERFGMRFGSYHLPSNYRIIGDYWVIYPS